MKPLRLGSRILTRRPCCSRSRSVGRTLLDHLYLSRTPANRFCRARGHPRRVSAVRSDRTGAGIRRGGTGHERTEHRRLLNRQWRSERRPIIAAAAAAVFLTVSGCAAAVIIGHTPTISAPRILDAQSSLSPGTDTAATPTSSSGTGTQSATSPPPEVPALGAQPTAQSWASEAESTSSESQPIPVSPGTGTEKSTTANVPAQQGSPITIQIDPLRIENLPPVVGPLDPVDPDTPDTPAVTAPTDTQTTPTQPSNPTDTTDPVVPNPDMPVMPLAPRPGMPS